MKSKRGSAWIWILIILVLIAVGIGLYIWLSGGDTTPVTDAGSNIANQIPPPPSLPD